MDIYDGVFNLMRADDAAVETKRFEYRFAFADRQGTSYRFNGYKVVRQDAGADVWRDTTRLFVDIAKGDSGQHGPLGRALLTIAPADFARQMQTLKGTGGRNAADRLKATTAFGSFFTRELYDTYAAVLKRADRYDAAAGAVRKKRNLRVPPPELHFAETTDGKRLKLSRYREPGATKGPLIFSHGLGVSSLIFSIDTIDTNMLEYMVAAGFDCWLLDFRASTDLGYCREQWTGDEVALLDYPAAVAKVRAVTGASSVQMMAHCFGATTFSMAMLAGLEGVRAATISQISTDYVVPFFPQRVLAYLRTPQIFDAFGIDVVNARATTADGLGGADARSSIAMGGAAAARGPHQQRHVEPHLGSVWAALRARSAQQGDDGLRLGRNVWRGQHHGLQAAGADSRARDTSSTRTATTSTCRTSPGWRFRRSSSMARRMARSCPKAPSGHCSG